MAKSRPGKTRIDTQRRIEETSNDELLEPVRGDPFGEPLSTKEQFALFEGVGEKRAETLAQNFDGLDDFQSTATTRFDELEGISQQKGATLSNEIIKRGISDIEERDDVRGGKRRQAEKINKTASRPFQLRDEQTVTPAERIQAENTHAERSQEAREVDEQRQAPVTGDYNQWANSPGRFDFAGVDSARDIDDEFEDQDARVSTGTVFESFVSQTKEKKQEKDDDVVFFAAEEFGLPL